MVQDVLYVYVYSQPKIDCWFCENLNVSPRYIYGMQIAAVYSSGYVFESKLTRYRDVVMTVGGQRSLEYLGVRCAIAPTGRPWMYSHIQGVRSSRTYYTFPSHPVCA